jgi:hypothetical protein
MIAQIVGACGFIAATMFLSGESPGPSNSEEADLRRVTVRVDPANLGNRPLDERPAMFHLATAEFAPGRRIDLTSLRVVHHDPRNRRDLSTPLPFRWYDDAIPYEFPECEINVHAGDGVSLRFVSRPRWGDFYSVLGDGLGGRFVWTHRQDGSAPSDYAISFRLLPQGKRPDRLPARGFVGDGSHRCAPVGASTTGMIHSRVTVADWDHDGLLDLLIGGGRGQVLVYPNQGTRTSPLYPFARFVATADGKPLDVGWSAAPLVVDWDGDGTLDLLCGAERNRILFFRNDPARGDGADRASRLSNRGFLTLDNQPIALPVTPVPKAPPGVFPLDYYPVLEAVDWNGDGRIDLLAGGFITGRVFWFENVGANPDGTPRLKDRGPLITEGHPLNVGDWAAAPTAADLDGDGDFDLITGSMAMTSGGGDSINRDHFLRYFENCGTRTDPRLVEQPFSKVGTFPAAGLGTPRAADLNGDGLLDLVVSAGENVFLFFNVGTPRRPRFAVHDRPLSAAWGSLPLPITGLQFLDWDGDGTRDFLSGLTVYRGRAKAGSQGEFTPEPLLQGDNRIAHPSPRGDSWIFTQLADLDCDGRLDLLFGTHEGNVWLHPNRGGRPPRFDEPGEQLKTTEGKAIRVGPRAGQPVDFDVLQGARTTFAAADFDRDGRLDLVVGDTYGKVRYFRNAGTRDGDVSRFEAPFEIADVKIRLQPFAADWDRDGQFDVIASAASGEIVWIRNLGKSRFAPGVPLPVPAVPYGPFASVVDWNGDGDEDLLVGTAYGYTCWFERSFLEQGYAIARLCPGHPDHEAGAPPDRSP